MFTARKMPYYACHRLQLTRLKITLKSVVESTTKPELSEQYSMHERENALKEWLEKTIKQENFVLTPLAGDASFRRYFRIYYNGISQVVMDAPPGKEDLQPFIHIAKVLSETGVCTPLIRALDLEQGFLLLSDFGDQLLLSALNTDTVDHYYQNAIDTIIVMQRCPIADPLLPSFDKAFMLKEMGLCSEWFFKAYLALDISEKEQGLIQNTTDWIATEVAQQPLVFIHRDYHSRNIMLVNEGQKRSLGVIDFQDAMRGPLTYDLVSLLKDCYISWPREAVLKWVKYFYEHNALAKHYTLAEFIRAFDLCGVQRHLKVLGVFCRLYLRDGKSGYLADLPLVLHYVLECSECYEELHPLFHFLQNKIFLP